MQRCSDATMQKCSDSAIQGCRDAGMQGCRDARTQGYRDTGIQGYRDVGMQGCNRMPRDGDGINLYTTRILHAHLYTCGGRESTLLKLHRKASLKFCESLLEHQSIEHFAQGIDCFTDLSGRAHARMHAHPPACTHVDPPARSLTYMHSRTHELTRPRAHTQMTYQPSVKPPQAKTATSVAFVAVGSACATRALLGFVVRTRQPNRRT